MFVRTEVFLDFDELAFGFFAFRSSTTLEPPDSTFAMDFISEIRILSTTKSESILAKYMQSFVKTSCLSRQITFACTVLRSTIPVSIQVSLGGSGVKSEARCSDLGDVDDGVLP